MALSNRQPDPDRRPTRRLWLLLLVVACVPGCATGAGPLSLLRMGRDSSLSKGPTAEELGDDRGLMARWLTPKVNPHSNPSAANPLVLGPNGWEPQKIAPDPESEKEFKAAEALFNEGLYAQAEPLFLKLAKKRKATVWGERAQFFAAESQFKRGKYVAAHDSYEVLVKDYPGGQFLDKLISREYAIAQAWLSIYDPNAKDQPKFSWKDRFNGRRPLLDTNGNATQALEHVRHHNPVGPLADDAVLRIADFHKETGDFESAAIYYDQLATDHPKSPYVQRAQLAAIESRMQGYIGPEYDGAGLEKAREQIKQTMAMFPDRPAGNEELYHKLDLMNDQEAERTYVVGEYYRRAGYISSSEYYFAKIPRRWPKSPWAVKAKTQLASLAKMPRTKPFISKILTHPGMNDPFSSGGGGMGGMGGGMGGMGGGGMGGMGGGGMGGMGGMGGGGMN